MLLQAGEAHHGPILVDLVNYYIGEPLNRFELAYTKPKWDWFFAHFHTTSENVFGAYTPENAVPWYTVMFIVACLVCLTLIWIFKAKLSEDAPDSGQQTLEVTVLTLRNMVVDVIGEHGMKYFPVVATFSLLILVSNLMGFFPLFMSPTASTSVTFALGVSSFVYYNGIGIKENGLFNHLKHFAGPIWWIAPLIFPIEIISNLIRPMTLGIRLFGNMFADEQLGHTIANLLPPYTYWILPVFLMPLGLFVAFVQTFVFTLLSMLYIAEVSHAPHSDHGAEAEAGDEDEGGGFIAPVLT